MTVAQELNYPDGKVEQVFLDGRRSVLFANGTRKQQFPDGHTAIRFTNNDIKRFFPCGMLAMPCKAAAVLHCTAVSQLALLAVNAGA